MKLQPSIGYGKTLENVSDADYRIKRDNYDKMLKDTLKFSMFVVCDEEGNVIEPPTAEELKKFEGLKYGDFDMDYTKVYQYYESLQDVLFEGWSYNKELHQIYFGHPDVLFNIEALQAYDIEMLTRKFNRNELTLTASAINKYQI